MTTLHGAYPTRSPILILPANVSDLRLIQALGRRQLYRHQTIKVDTLLSMPLSRSICCGANFVPSKILSNVTVRSVPLFIILERCHHDFCLPQSVANISSHI
ncbi:hypothetical protein FOXG_17796 [Fusarium oxysporum f. sp. lycopersici 4287]|uniref:Uncharacterized protein n=1 Tax=Fusarium oxysporum f. sp. lycopersici (strain 4287 / CBS 123668 / FGSC 9935 / NRRL 34936) TaxID=426428 RepID=A0A0J9U6B3_FUSO4|nr:hypothetical protein FOXG_17796 [Fusarium oxysporum f. sp. lycopersici 4287]KNA93625.1 hypothetical protein FOXG_17796 [Fusarium oxysporum f. sp. lycopersici 4287]